MPVFTVSREDSEKIDKILDRIGVAPGHRMALEISLNSCHANVYELDLDAMLAWPHDYDIAHDVYGIDFHTNRRTRVIEDCFVPRFVKRSHVGTEDV